MGERTSGVEQSELPANGTQPAPIAPPETVQQLGSEIAALRVDLDGLVAELDRRRHEVFDLRLQARRHARGIALTIIGLVGAAAGFVWMGTWRARRQDRLASRAGRFGQGLSRMIDQPEHVAAGPTVPAKIMMVAANAAVAVFIKKVLEYAVASTMDRQRRRDHAAAPTVDQPRTVV
jgi:hypothetical protein